MSNRVKAEMKSIYIIKCRQERVKSEIWGKRGLILRSEKRVKSNEKLYPK